MKFLIAIKDNSEESKHIMDVGCKIAEGFSADLTICYVGNKSKALIEGDVNLARLSMEEWNIYHPGLEVLKWAFNILNEKQFVSETTFDEKNLVEKNGKIHFNLPKTKKYQIRLVLREGDLLSELNQEVKDEKFDIAILGSPSRKRLIQKLAQFVDTSLFFVKNFNPHLNYKIILCVDDSRATKRAIILCARISKQFNAKIKSITVSKKSSFGQDYRNANIWSKKYLERQNLPLETKLLIGNPVDVFIREANEDHIIIMGKAKGNEFIKFIFGSKPIHTAQKANCPVLLVN